jgi:uncharacterized membrane protein YbhN (UPF0104 family)
MANARVGKLATILLAGSLFAASVWYLVDRFQWREAFAQLLGTDFVRLVALVWIVQAAYIGVRTLRWRVVVQHTNPEVRYVDLYWITAVVVSLAILTPGQLGEALKIELLKRRGLLGRLHGTGAFALERILDVLVVAAMGAIGLFFGSGFSARYPGLATGTAIIFALGLAALYVLLHFDPAGRTSHWLGQLRAGSGSPRIWMRMAALTVVSWGLVGLGWQVALNAIGIYLSLPAILWLISLVTLGTLLSLVPGGFGVAEVLTVEVLVNMGIAPVAAQTGALILRVYGLMILIFGLIHLAVWIVFGSALGIRSADRPK